MFSIILSKLAIARVVIGVFGALLLNSPAFAAKVPDPTVQENLIKSTLLTFNDANVTGIYDVLHAKLSKQFRDQFSKEKLAESFKPFHEKGINFLNIVSMKVNYSEEPTVDGDDVLTMRGYFETAPNKVYFRLRFVMSDGVWKPLGITVDLKK